MKRYTPLKCSTNSPRSSAAPTLAIKQKVSSLSLEPRKKKITYSALRGRMGLIAEEVAITRHLDAWVALLRQFVDFVNILSLVGRQGRCAEVLILYSGFVLG